jgi:hypothetical protein
MLEIIETGLGRGVNDFVLVAACVIRARRLRNLFAISERSSTGIDA